MEISLDDYLNSPRFSRRERAAVLWAEHVAKNTARERDDVFEEVHKHFNDAELVELTGVCGQFASSNRFQDSLRLPIEEHGEVSKIKGSLHADSNLIKASLERLIEYWPNEFPEASKGISDVALSMTARSSLAATSSRAANGTAWAARVPMLDPNMAKGESARFFEASQLLFGGVSNAVRMWAHIPYVAKLIMPFQSVMEHDGAGNMLPITLKMMVLVRTGYLNSAAYSVAHRSAAGRLAGLTEDQLAALATDDCADSCHFSRRERAAVLWAEHVASNTAKRRDDVFDRLTPHFNDQEIVELTGVCAMGNQMDRIYNALRLPLESDREIEALHRTTWLDPGRLKTYVETLIAHWPKEFPVPTD